MRFWMRKSYLTLGGKRYSLDNMRFKFKVVFEDRPKLSTAEIEIYNLAPDTRGGLQKGLPVILTAGYQDDIGTIFVGEVREFSSKIEELDNITTVRAADSMEAWLSGEINKTYKPGMSAKDIIDDLLNVFGIEVSMNELKENKYYPRARVCKGKLKDVLTELVCSDCKSRLIIRTGQIYINPPEQGINQGVLLTPETGLLKASKKEEKQDANTEKKPGKKTRAQQNVPEGGLQKVCLLNHEIGCADVVTIRDSETNGSFLVVRGTHEGSRDGDWKTTMELKPY